jgi:hypothetical protein
MTAQPLLLGVMSSLRVDNGVFRCLHDLLRLVQILGESFQLLGAVKLLILFPSLPRCLVWTASLSSLCCSDEKH